jgi:hypothetical protein
LGLIDRALKEGLLGVKRMTSLSDPSSSDDEEFLEEFDELEPGPHQEIISKLHPTQRTIGSLQVEMKMRAWGFDEKDQSNRHDACKRRVDKHLIPVVIGYDKRYYLIDRHHFVFALWMAKWRESVYIRVKENLSRLTSDEFWYVLDVRGWCHPFDENGHRCARYEEIPESIEGMADDPFRSLAGVLRRSGVFAKDITPFSEFQWANFLRSKLEEKPTKANFKDMLNQAKKFARQKHAKYLPGWCGESLGRPQGCSTLNT